MCSRTRLPFVRFLCPPPKEHVKMLFILVKEGTTKRHIFFSGSWSRNSTLFTKPKTKLPSSQVLRKVIKNFELRRRARLTYPLWTSEFVGWLEAYPSLIRMYRVAGYIVTRVSSIIRLSSAEAKMLNHNCSHRTKIRENWDPFRCLHLAHGLHNLEFRGVITFVKLDLVSI
jgi:hypothetical protein